MNKPYKVVYSNQSNHIYDKLLCDICHETSLRNNFSTHKKSKKHLNALNIEAQEPEEAEEPEEEQEEAEEAEETEEDEENEDITFDDLKPEIQRFIYKNMYCLNDNDYHKINNIIINKLKITESYLLYIFKKLNIKI